MSAKKFFRKVWLKPNLLTKDVANDFPAEVSTAGKTLRNEDIASDFQEEGTELQFETLLDILNRADRLQVKRVVQGYTVLSGTTRISPRVLGGWIGNLAKFDPEKHRITADMTPSAELHAALRDTGIEVMGVKDSGALISLVTDAATGKIDGTVTAGDDIIARVPSLAAGSYTLVVKTRFSQGSVLLKEVRTLTCDLPLTVAQGGAQSCSEEKKEFNCSALDF
jgi:hypothetical protein